MSLESLNRSIVVGKKYVFRYPEEFVTLPEYSDRRGVVVSVVRPCNEDEAEPPSADVEALFIIRASDGWEGMAWASELEVV